MNSQIDEFEQIMLDYLKGEISSEDMQKLTILLKRENVCREKYREIARSYALASSSWFARRKERNLEQLRDTLNFHSSRKHSFFRKISVWGSVAVWALLIWLQHNVLLFISFVWSRGSCSLLLSD